MSYAEGKQVEHCRSAASWCVINCCNSLDGLGERIIVGTRLGSALVGTGRVPVDVGTGRVPVGDKLVAMEIEVVGMGIGFIKGVE